MNETQPETLADLSITDIAAGGHTGQGARVLLIGAIPMSEAEEWQVRLHDALPQSVYIEIAYGSRVSRIRGRGDLLMADKKERAMMNEVQREMPRYQSIKQVWALKIAAVEVLSDEEVRLRFVEPGYTARTVRAGTEIWKRLPDDKAQAAGGYLVVYEGGFSSWSPGDVFEKGYVPIQGTVG